jgi:hypothetical protein
MDDDHPSIFERTSKKNEIKRQALEAQIRSIVATIISSMVACFVFFLMKESFSESFLCRFAEAKSLLYLWPPNGSIVDSLDITKYSLREKCEFLAMRSIISGTLLPYIVYILLKQIKSRDDYYTVGAMLPFVFIFIMGIYTAFSPISSSYSRFHLFAGSSVGANLLKSSISIYGSYFCLYMIAYRLCAYIRSYLIKPSEGM